MDVKQCKMGHSADRNGGVSESKRGEHARVHFPSESEDIEAIIDVSVCRRGRFWL